MRLLIIRHADPDYSLDALTDHGRLEAAALAERLKRTGLDRIFCSPMGRARETMRYAADALGMEATIEPWTRELEGLRVPDSPWGDLNIWDYPGEAIRSGPTADGKDGWRASPLFAGGPVPETCDRVARDSDAFLKRLGFEREGCRYRMPAPNSEKIAVFCHGAFGLTWLAHLLGLPLVLVWSGFWLPPASVTSVLFDERAPGRAVPRCIQVGDTSHLYAAGLRENPRGIKANFY